MPPPASEPASYVSAVSELRLYDDMMAIPEYDIPEDRFRQLAYVDRNARPIQAILQYRPALTSDHQPANHVANFDYQVRFEDSASLQDSAWLPYSAVHHTFAFEAFYNCARRELSGHVCIAIPAPHRQVHQSHASAASRQRRNQARHASAAAAFDATSLLSLSDS